MENSIEDTKKQLELMLKVRKEQKEIIECAGGSCMNCDPDIKALSRSIEILSDYKRVLKENEKLKKSKITYEKVRDIQEKNKNIVDNNYIPKQKIKDKIDKLQDDLKYIACGNNDCNKCFSEYRGSNFVYCYAYHQIKVLNELLESEE